jgi:hypothetical protein
MKTIADTYIEAFLKFDDDSEAIIPDEVSVGMALFFVKTTRDLDGATKMIPPSLLGRFERALSDLEVA